VGELEVELCAYALSAFAARGLVFSAGLSEKEVERPKSRIELTPPIFKLGSGRRSIQLRYGIMRDGCMTKSTANYGTEKGVCRSY
jgi:hypothetical protein